MLEKYYKYKIEYKEFILMIKFGNFYEMFDKDAVIESKLLNYKISKISDTVKYGFPVSSLEKVLNKLNEENRKIFNNGRKEALSYIQNILKEKLPIDLISKITGKTKDEIEKIKFE